MKGGPGRPTNGQLLYEHYFPTHVAMVPFANRQFATVADIVMVKTEHPSWHFLSEKVKASYEERAKLHHLFQKGS